MLDELFPVQFVEGLNEGAEPSDEEPIVITNYSGTGLQYVPKISYLLTRLETILVFGDIPEGAQIRVELRSDYEERPSDIILSSGKFVPTEVSQHWQEVMLKPVSVIKGGKYWVTIHPNRCPTVLVTTEKGQGCLLSVRADTRWKIPPEDVRTAKVMLRLYGRILPLSAS